MVGVSKLITKNGTHVPFLYSPGQHMARASIWITVASILATFNIQKATDNAGKTIEPSGKYSSGLVRFVPLVSSLLPNTTSRGL